MANLKQALLDAIGEANVYFSRFEPYNLRSEDVDIWLAEAEPIIDYLRNHVADFRVVLHNGFDTTYNAERSRYTRTEIIYDEVLDTLAVQRCRVNVMGEPLAYIVIADTDMSPHDKQKIRKRIQGNCFNLFFM